jgi:hypothetical protein
MLTHFTDPTILEKIGRSPLAKLLSDTAPDSDSLKQSLPGDDAGNDEYCAAFAAAIAFSNLVPAKLRDALLLIEKAAEPQFRDRLDAERKLRFPCVSFNSFIVDLDTALSLWFTAPAVLHEIVGASCEGDAQRSPHVGSAHTSDEPDHVPGASPVFESRAAEPSAIASEPVQVAPESVSHSDSGVIAVELSHPTTPAGAFSLSPSEGERGPFAPDLLDSKGVGPLPPPLAALAVLPRHKINHLPEPVRESINVMLRDCLPLAEILRQLGDAGKGLNKDNLRRWKKTGYQEWLKEQQRREDAQARTRLLLSGVQDNESSRIHQASQQIAALQVAELLTTFDLAALKQSLQTDGANYVRLLNALPRLSQGGLACERQRIEADERRVKLEKARNPQRPGISDEALAIAEAKLRLL